MTNVNIPDNLQPIDQLAVGTTAPSDRAIPGPMVAGIDGLHSNRTHGYIRQYY